MNGHADEVAEKPRNGGPSALPSLFDVAHSRKPHAEPAKHLHEHHHPLDWRHLVKKPVIRQWLVGDVLAREAEEREASKFELFLDLCLIGVVHQLAAAAEEETSSWGNFKFAVCFYLAWSIWLDIRDYINLSGTDDVPQRFVIFAWMALLLGLSANSAGLKIECSGGETGPDAAQPEVARLMRRFNDATEPTHLPDGCELAVGWESHLRALLGFYLVAKLARIALHVVYAFFLPRFRKPLLVRAAIVAACQIFWLPLLGVQKLTAVLVLAIVAILAEMLSTYIYTVYSMIKRRRGAGEHKQSKRAFNFTPALSLDHYSERMTLFVMLLLSVHILVLGEFILNITFVAVGSQTGVHAEYGRCILGLLCAFSLAWALFDADGSRTFLHGLRRNAFTSATFQLLHFPLTASLILASSAMPEMVQTTEPVQRARWLLCGGIATAVVCLALIGALHLTLDKPGSALIGRQWRLLVRVLAAVIIALIPLARDRLTSTSLLAIVASVLVVMVIFETVGKLGAIADDERVNRLFPGSSGAAIASLHRQLGHTFSEPDEHPNHLNDQERGEDDAGVEGDVGAVSVVALRPAHRLAYAF